MFLSLNQTFHTLQHMVNSEVHHSIFFKMSNVTDGHNSGSVTYFLWHLIFQLESPNLAEIELDMRARWTIYLGILEACTELLRIF